ncbi:MAG: anhydro-N-acetylmuramic acid kinase [Coxiellaceae bacterium]|nr:anhydro-N-acetylmuramic acid kinase [Coxiellaceae bacterium]|tara:strand:+ start:2620 stop:3732 length:1113 start_codon:yes stop_codon:yes gene_type:complete
MTQEAYFIGLMSGTSINAIDATLVSIKNHTLELIETHSELIPFQIKQAIKELCVPGFNSIHKLGSMDTQLGRLFANTVLNLLKKSDIPYHKVTAIGTHGQTVRHEPNHEFPFSIQIADPNIISAHTGITTVADFRRRDIAHSGQGAPLTPAFHQFLLQNTHEEQWVLNIGGIANVTLISNNIASNGFDTGPGNILLDAWCEKHTKKPYDDMGQWAQSGKTHHQLLEHLLRHPYFKSSPPKSTGRESFNLEWLNTIIRQIPSPISPEDTQATLVELTAQTIADSIQQYQINPTTITVCGGGAYNEYLLRRLASHCKNYTIRTTSTFGINPEWVEACAFAWFAQQTLEKRTINLMEITGATRPSVLGAIYTA